MDKKTINYELPEEGINDALPGDYLVFRVLSL
jgi:hypothetical protein